MSGYVWGVDVAGNGLALAVLYEGKFMAERTIEVNGKIIATRLQRIRRAVLADLMGDLAIVMPPQLICVEQPAGRFPNPALMAAWGVVLEALSRIAGEAVVEMTPPAWRGHIGFARQPDPVELTAEAEATRSRPLPLRHPLRSPYKRRALGIARAAGYTGINTEIGDATCIGLAGEVWLAKTADVTS